MSAFVIGTETMDRVVSTLCAKTQYGYVLSQIGDDFVDAKDAPTKIGRKLFAMNVDAVKQRYGSKADDQWDGQSYRPKARQQPATLADWVAGFKAIQCLGYQCSEGNIPESALYKELQRAEGVIAAKIVQMLPDYDKAPWG